MMTRRLLFFFMCSIAGHASLAQTFLYAEAIAKMTSTLQKRGVDTLLVYEYSCRECDELHTSFVNDTCLARTHAFILWREKGKDSVMRISKPCDVVLTKKGNFGDIWSICYAQKEKIKTERFITPAYVNMGDTIRYTSNTKTGELWCIRIFYSGKPLEYFIHEAYVKGHVYTYNQSNINYNKNINLQRKRLQEEVMIAVYTLFGSDR